MVIQPLSPWYCIMAEQLDVVYDTDIGRDPDDALSLLWLLSRSDVKLRALTITPGDADQVALAQFLLDETGNSDIPIGIVPGRAKGKRSVGGCHLRLMAKHGAQEVGRSDGAGWEILADALQKYPSATLLTTGPLNNIADLLRNTSVRVERAVSMGGYWGAPGQPETMPEFNFSGCIWATEAFVASSRFGKRLLVGKNVTHQVLYDDGMHEEFGNVGRCSRPLALVHELMSLRSGKKKLHDPVATAAVIHEGLFTWEEVLPIKRKNHWGSIRQTGTGIWAATSLDALAFRRAFAGGPL